METGRSVKVLDEDTGEWVQYRVTRVDNDVLHLRDQAGAVRSISAHDPLLDWPDGAEAVFSSLSYMGNPPTAVDSIPEVSRAVQQLQQVSSDEHQQHSQQAAFIREFQLEDERQIVDQLSQDTFPPLDAIKSSASNGFASMERSVGYDASMPSVGTLADANTVTLESELKHGYKALAPPIDGSVRAPSNVYDDANASVPDGQMSSRLGSEGGDDKAGMGRADGHSGLDYSFHSHSIASSPTRERGAEDVLSESAERAGRVRVSRVRRREGTREGHRAQQVTDSTSRLLSHASHTDPHAMAPPPEQHAYEHSQRMSVYPEVLGLSDPYPIDYGDGFCRPAGAAERIAAMVLQSVHEGPVLPMTMPVGTRMASGMHGLLAGSALALHGAQSLVPTTGGVSVPARIFVRVCVVQAGEQIVGTAANSRTIGPPGNRLDSSRGKARHVRVSAPGTRPVTAHAPLADYSVKPDLRINPTTSRRMPIYRTQAREVVNSATESVVTFTAVDLEEGKTDERVREDGAAPSMDASAAMMQFACSLSTTDGSPEPVVGSQASLDWNFLRGYVLFQVFEERPTFDHAPTCHNVLVGHGLVRICDVFAACVRPHRVQHNESVHGDLIQQEFYMRLWLPIQPCSGPSQPHTMARAGPAGVGRVGVKEAGKHTSRAQQRLGFERQSPTCSLQVELSLTLPAGIFVPSESLRLLDPAQPPPLPGLPGQVPPHAQTVQAQGTFVDARRSPSPERKQRSPGSTSKASSVNGTRAGQRAASRRRGHAAPLGSPGSAAVSVQMQGQPSNGYISEQKDVRSSYMQLPAAAIYAPANGVFGSKSPSSVRRSAPSSHSDKTGDTLHEDGQGKAPGRPSSPTSYHSGRSVPKRPGSASSRASARGSVSRAHPAMAGAQYGAAAKPWTASTSGAQGKEPPSSPSVGRPAPRRLQASPYRARPAGLVPVQLPVGVGKHEGQGHEGSQHYAVANGTYSRDREHASSSRSDAIFWSAPVHGRPSSHQRRAARQINRERKDEGEETKFDESSPVEAQQAVLVRAESAGSIATDGGSAGIGTGGAALKSGQGHHAQRNELDTVRARLEQLQTEMHQMQALLDLQQH